MVPVVCSLTYQMMFFHIFYRHLTKISEIETVDIGPRNRSGGRQKQIKLIIFFHKNIIVNQLFYISNSKPGAKILF